MIDWPRGREWFDVLIFHDPHLWVPFAAFCALYVAQFVAIMVFDLFKERP